jgi:hypothetical protein
MRVKEMDQALMDLTVSHTMMRMVEIEVPKEELPALAVVECSQGNGAGPISAMGMTRAAGSVQLWYSCVGCGQM